MDGTDTERRRLKILRRLNILDSPPERMIDDIATIASQLLGTPMSAVTLIDESRQWFKASVGIDLVETPRSVAFCDHTIRSVAPFVVRDAAIDARFENNPLVVGPPHIRSYAGVPLRVGGVQVGALCVIDTQSREFSAHDITALQALGRLVTRMFELRWRRQLAEPPSDAYVFDLAGTIDTADDFHRLLADEVRPAWLYDRSSLRFLAVNESAVEQYGWSRDQFLAMTLADVQPLDDAPAFRSRTAPERTAAEEVTGRSRRHVKADGTDARVHLSFAPVKSATINGELVVVTDLTARNQGRNALVHAATHDPLTGLPTRTEFHRQVSRMLEVHPGRPLALLFVDLDGFKLVNDTAGHVAGDVLLAATADRLNRSLRDTDLLARMGGDEFAIACTGATLDDVLEVARRIAESMKQPLLVNERQHFLTASIGIAVSDATSTCEGMLIEADLAMLAAKAAGRGTAAVFDQKLRSTVAKRAAIEHDLHVAIARREFELYYQPIVGLNNKAVHFEALLRWNHPTRGVLAPAEFLSVAEEAGLIVPIGSWVLREAAACSVRLNRSHPGTRVAFNLATQQLTGALIAEVEAVLAETGAEPHHLIAEVTESGLTTKEAGLVTRRLQQMGLAISIDDFGTGHSSLGRLRELDVDALKLDRCFVNELGSRHGRRMIAAIIQLARAVDLPVVVEGVETTEQLTLLRELDCDYVQGYLFARPMPETHVADWFSRMFVGGFAGRTGG